MSLPTVQDQPDRLLEHWQEGRGNTAIARSLGVYRKTVRKHVEAAKARSVERSTPLPQEQWVAVVREHFPDRKPKEVTSS